jgi:hypothetical protein
VVQLVARARHVHARDLGAVAGRRRIEIQHGKGVARGRIGIEQRHIGKRFDRRLHRHRRRRIEALVGKQFWHGLVPHSDRVLRLRRRQLALFNWGADR